MVVSAAFSRIGPHPPPLGPCCQRARRCAAPASSSWFCVFYRRIRIPWPSWRLEIARIASSTVPATWHGTARQPALATPCDEVSLEVLRVFESRQQWGPPRASHRVLTAAWHPSSSSFLQRGWLGTARNRFSAIAAPPRMAFAIANHLTEATYNRTIGRDSQHARRRESTNAESRKVFFIFFPTLWVESSREFRCEFSQPEMRYMAWAPNTAFPRAAACTRTWCVRPVSSSISSQDLLALTQTARSTVFRLRGGTAG